jgi:hypothetical protein
MLYNIIIASFGVIDLIDMFLAHLILNFCW